MTELEQFLSELSFKTHGEGFLDITAHINNWIKEHQIRKGIIVITLKHTSCSLIINENADPKVLQDLSSYLKAIVPENGFQSILPKGNIQTYLHSEEGIDDMPAHIKTALTLSSLTLSIKESRLDLGTWQAVYIWEHRYSENIRKLNLHSIGETTQIKIRKSNQNLNTMMATKDPSKLNKVVKNQNNMNFSNQENDDTKTDILIDRIHDLTSQTE